MKYLKKRYNQGITTLSLVVTVIILIILATTSVTMVFGQEGLIEETKEDQNEIEQELTNSQSQIDASKQEYLNAMYVSP